MGCRHPFQESKRAWVIPSKVEPLYTCWWTDGHVPVDYPSLAEIRQSVQDSLKTLRQDHKRSLNPTPYKVGVSDDLYHFIHDLWLENQPIGELSWQTYALDFGAAKPTSSSHHKENNANAANGANSNSDQNNEFQCVARHWWKKT